MNDCVSSEHLRRPCQATKPRCAIERSPAEASIHRHRLPHVQTDADEQRERGILFGFEREGRLQIDGRAQCLSRRAENCQDLVAPHLDYVAPALRHHLSSDTGKFCRQPRRGLVPVFSRKTSVASHVGD